MNQPSEESLEGAADELEHRKEITHLLQAQEEKSQQFQEEMRQPEEEEEAEKLRQQKEKSLRYFLLLLHLPPVSPLSCDFIAGGHRLGLL